MWMQTQKIEVFSYTLVYVYNDLETMCMPFKQARRSAKIRAGRKLLFVNRAEAEKIVRSKNISISQVTA